LLRIDRKRRQADPSLGDRDSDTEGSGDDSPSVGNEFFGPLDNVGPPPDEPLHKNASWPTSSNLTQEQATRLCDGAIKNFVKNTTYEVCLGYAGLNLMSYVNSCLADILVTFFIMMPF